jgi:hypothetical protein
MLRKLWDEFYYCHWYGSRPWSWSTRAWWWLEENFDLCIGRVLFLCLPLIIIWQTFIRPQPEPSPALAALERELSALVLGLSAKIIADDDEARADLDRIEELKRKIKRREKEERSSKRRVTGNG